MKKIVVLLQKEIKENQRLFLFIIAAITCVEVYALTLDGFIIKFLLLFFPIPIVTILLPFLLARSYSNEWQRGTHLLLLSLPVPRYYIGLSKLGAIFMLGTVIFAIVMGSVHYSVFIDINSYVSDFMANFRITPKTIWGTAASFYFVPLFLFLSLVTVSEALKSSLKSFHGFIPIGTFLIGLYLYAKFFIDFISFFPRTGSGNYATTPYATVESFLAGFASVTGYTMIFAFCALIVGLFVLEKFAEA